MRNIFKREKKQKTGKTLLVVGLALCNLALLAYIIWDKLKDEKYSELEQPKFVKKSEDFKEDLKDELKDNIEDGLEEAEDFVEEITDKFSPDEIVGSTESDKYHKPTCRYAKDMDDENLIIFESVEDAEERGYKACGVCH